MVGSWKIREIGDWQARCSCTVHTPMFNFVGMLIRASIVTATLSSCCAIQAATQLRGRISDHGAPVAGAIVTISNHGFLKSVKSDGDGRFTFDAVPRGQYDFRMTASGYAVVERPVTVRFRYIHRNRIDVKHLIASDEQTVSIDALPNRTQLRVGFTTGR